MILLSTFKFLGVKNKYFRSDSNKHHFFTFFMQNFKIGCYGSTLDGNQLILNMIFIVLLSSTTSLPNVNLYHKPFLRYSQRVKKVPFGLKKPGYNGVKQQCPVMATVCKKFQGENVHKKMIKAFLGVEIFGFFFSLRIEIL